MRVRELTDKLQQQDLESIVFIKCGDKTDNICEVWSEKKSWIKNKNKNTCFIGYKTLPEYNNSHMYLNSEYQKHNNYNKYWE